MKVSSISELQKIASDLDKEIAALPKWVIALINQRIMTARLIEAQLIYELADNQSMTQRH